MHPTAKGRTASIRGTTLHWVELGDERNETERPLVLLHGLYDSHRTWSRVVAQLAERRRVLVLDLPGHGLSERPDASYAIDWYAEIVAAWVDALDLRSIDLVGHSFGGGV